MQTDHFACKWPHLNKINVCIFILFWKHCHFHCSIFAFLNFLRNKKKNANQEAKDQLVLCHYLSFQMLVSECKLLWKSIKDMSEMIYVLLAILIKFKKLKCIFDLKCIHVFEKDSEVIRPHIQMNNTSVNLIIFSI